MVAVAAMAVVAMAANLATVVVAAVVTAALTDLSLSPKPNVETWESIKAKERPSEEVILESWLNISVGDD